MPLSAKTQGGTIEHESDNPTRDDRPWYLQDAAYLLALDTETDGFEWYGEHRPFVATVSDCDRDYLYLMCDHPLHPGVDAITDRHDLRAAVLNADGLILHNAPFDIHMLVADGLFELEELLALEIHDTSVLARIVLPDEEVQWQYGLKHLTTLLVDSEAGASEVAVKEAMFGLGLTKRADQKNVPDYAYRRVWEHFPDLLETYALADTRSTYDLFYTLLERATEHDLLCYELERAVLPEIVRMEDRGIKLDPARVAQLHSEYEVQAQDALAVLQEHHLDFNPDSNDQVAEMLIGAGVPLSDLTDSGQIRVDKWVLERHTGHPLVDALLTYRMYAKFLSTYIGPMMGKEVIHPGIWQIGARTGRMSSSNPNMQNIPVRSGPEVRSVLVPRDDYAFVVADYASIELRVLAYYMASPTFTQIVLEGSPFHWLGEQLFGTDQEAAWPIPRQALKNGFYALLYGAGGPKLASTIGGGMSAQEGRDFAKQIKGVLGAPYRKLNRRVQDQIEQIGYVRTLSGRTQWVPKDRAYTGLNYLIQGSAADIMKWGLINTAEALRHVGGYVLLPVHDELVCEVPADIAPSTPALIKQAMIAATDKILLDVGVSICAKNYSEAK